MIITISGTLGTEGRIVGRLLSRKLGMKHHSTGRFVRNLAEREDLQLEDFAKVAEEDPNIDNEMDMMIAEHGRTRDNFILDSKMAFHFIPNSFKVLLKADFKKRVRRNFKYEMRTEFNVTLESTAERIKRIDDSDKKRFLEKYHLDFTDPSHYDLVIDNTDLSLEECADIIVEHLKKKGFITKDI